MDIGLIKFKAALTAIMSVTCVLPINTALAEAPPKYSAEAFYTTTDFGLPNSPFVFSGDHEKLLITSNENGVFNAYDMDLESGNRTALTNSTTNAVYAISYIPNSERFLYTFDGGGNELNHVYVDGPDMEPKDLTPGENLKAAFVGWINDGKSFILQTNERDSRYFDLYKYDTNSFEREMIFANDLGLGGVRVSRDGLFAAGVKARTSADNDVYLISLDGDNEATNITAHEGNVSHAVYDFTPEGDKLVFGTNEFGEFAQAWAYTLSSGEKSALIEEDWAVSYVGFSPSGRYRVHGTNADATTIVTIIDRNNGKSLKLPKKLPKGNVGSVRFSPDEKALAFTINSPTSPSNIFTADIKGKSFNQHTAALNPEIDTAHLVESEVIRYESYDGLMIPSILYKPKGASAENPAPALVWVHGGPGGQTRTGYSATIQHLVNHGYAVLGANNRGSSGYGKTFFHLDDKKHGEDDLQDIVRGRAYLESLDWVDGDKVGIIGGSYGGYMVMAALAFEPEAFDVGVNIFGVTNWVRTLVSIPPWWESFKESLYDEMGDPATDGERHRRISPLFHADNITKPVLVVQGANDPRVLQVESDEMVAALRENDVPVEYVLFPDEGHGFRRRENRIAASEAYVSFLDTYLRGETD